MEEQRKQYPDNAFKPLDLHYIKTGAAPEGSVVRFEYDTKNHLKDDGKTYRKSALVYLPAGYDGEDASKRYNVLYLMHGGSDSPEWYLGSEHGSSQITRMLDNLIGKGDIEPVIICAVSYYNDYCEDATTNCKGFWQELTEDIMPVFETQYRTYAKDVTPDDFKDTRRHRAFGGFSMGAAATWGVFEHCLDSVAYYLPMSGDCWALGMKAGGTQPDATAKYLADAVKASGWSKNDYYIYSGCGSKDIAEPNLTPQVEAMKKMTDAFVWCDNFADGNLYECIIENGGHDVNTVIRVMFNGLPKMFG